MSDLTIKTNNVYRSTIDAYQLSEKERKEFSYLNWKAIDEGSDNATFFKYKKQLYDLGEFMCVPDNSGFSAWHGYSSNSYFSGVLVRYSKDFESVLIGTYYS
jgi:hypothetical protein